MPRYGFVADVHVGNHNVFGGDVRLGMNARCRMVVDALGRAVAKASDEECDHLVVLGDLFDTARPLPQMLRAVRDALAGCGKDVWLLRGNHDARSDEPGDDALSVLERWDAAARVHVYPNAHGDGGMIEGPDERVKLVPHSASRPMRALVREAMETFHGDPKAGRLPIRGALAFHAGLQRSETPDYLRSDTSTVLLDELLEFVKYTSGLRAVFCGDWHEHFHHWYDPSGIGHEGTSTHIVQVGSLVPKDFAEAGNDFHGLVVWDSYWNTIKKHTIAGPRFLKARVADDAFWDEAYSMRTEGDATELYASFEPTSAREAEQTHESVRKHETILTAYRVLPSKYAAREQARTQAVAVSTSLSFDEAVRAYVATMPEPAQGVTHDDVYHRVRALLAQR